MDLVYKMDSISLKKMSNNELKQLSKNIRIMILHILTVIGGNIPDEFSNVEITIAIHKLFDKIKVYYDKDLMLAHRLLTDKKNILKKFEYLSTDEIYSKAMVNNDEKIILVLSEKSIYDKAFLDLQKKDNVIVIINDKLGLNCYLQDKLNYFKVNGHSIRELVEVLNKVKDINKFCVIHSITTAGYGYKPLEINSDIYKKINPNEYKLSAKGIQRVSDKKNIFDIFLELIQDDCILLHSYFKSSSEFVYENARIMVYNAFSFAKRYKKVAVFIPCSEFVNCIDIIEKNKNVDYVKFYLENDIDLDIDKKVDLPIFIVNSVEKVNYVMNFFKEYIRTSIVKFDNIFFDFYKKVDYINEVELNNFDTDVIVLYRENIKVVEKINNILQDNKILYRELICTEIIDIDCIIDKKYIFIVENENYFYRYLLEIKENYNLDIKIYHINQENLDIIDNIINKFIVDYNKIIVDQSSNNLDISCLDKNIDIPLMYKELCNNSEYFEEEYLGNVGLKMDYRFSIFNKYSKKSGINMNIPLYYKELCSVDYDEDIDYLGNFGLKDYDRMKRLKLLENFRVKQKFTRDTVPKVRLKSIEDIIDLVKKKN